MNRAMNTAGLGAGTATWLLPPGMLAEHVDADAPLKDICVADLRIRQLRGDQIAQITQLRGEIDLAAAASADPDFMAREKKETNWGWCTPSN